MRTGNNENYGYFVGCAETDPVFSHESHGEDYYSFRLRISRLSGAEDVLDVTVSRSQLELCPVQTGMRLEIRGEVRSFNNRSGTGRRLILSVFARYIQFTAEEDENQVRISGVLCKDPIYRKTPLGREICDMMLAVNRRYGRADYLPCITWGALARECSGLRVGDALRMEGRFQSREYIKTVDGTGQRRVAYEVSVMNLLAAEE